MVAVMERASVQAPTEGRYAALYIRVSSGKQRENWSVQDQRALAQLGEQRGYRVVVYEEQGVSGETLEARPVMQRLLDDVRAGKVAAIIVVATNRLSRDEDIIDTLVIQKTCRETDTLVITPEQTFNYAERTDTMFGQIRAIFDADQKQALVKATTRGVYAKARAGGWVGGITPFGYRVVRDVPHMDGRMRGRLVIDDDEAAIVRLVFELYTNGEQRGGQWHPLTMSAIVRTLNERGHTFKVRAQKQRQEGRGGKRWGTGEPRPFELRDVARILSQRDYLGLFVRGETSLSKWVRADGPVEHHNPELRIVDVAVWQRAQASRKERAGEPRRLIGATQPLAGLLRCSHCRGPMASCATTHRLADGSPARYAAYQCLNARKFGRRVCEGSNVSERLARAAVERLLLERIEELRVQSRLAEAAADAAHETEDEAAQRILAELQQTKAGIGRLIDAVADGALSSAEVRTKKVDLMEKQERLEARLAKLRQNAEARTSYAEALAWLQRGLPEALREIDGAHFRRIARIVFRWLVVTSEGSGAVRTATVTDHELTERYRETVSTYGTIAEQVVPSE